MSSPPRQLILDLPLEPSRAREDFVETAANRAALRLVEAWPDWPAKALVLVGPEGSGKSHLAAIWRARAGAVLVDAADLDPRALDALPAGAALLIEDVDTARPAEAALFHALNLTRERELWCLMTARLAPARWPVALPDLASRLKALPTVELREPDDLLLTAVMAKQFADRQIAVDPGVIAYLVTRMERSLGAAGRLVAALDALSLAEGRRITRALASRALAETRTSISD